MTEVGPEVVEELRQRLVDARERLLRTASLTGEELASLDDQPREPFKDVPVLAGADTLSRLEGRERHQLDEILAALNRLEAGTYGVCETCSRPIPLVRLRALPTTRHCVECQAHQEHRSPIS
jgi:RNA polymerase-binding transcription factor